MKQRSVHPGTRSRRTKAALVTAVALVAQASLWTGGNPATANPGPPDAGLTLHSSLLEGVVPTAQAISLITGEQIQLVPTATGGYQVMQQPSSSAPERQQRPETPLTLRSVEKPGQPAVITAVPVSAGALVAAGRIDRHLFDVTYLAQHGFGAATTPVTLHYAEVHTAADAASAADALPGSSYVQDTATGNQATVSVPVASADSFWNAVTQAKAFDPGSPEGRVWSHDNPSTPRELKAGLAGLTLDGAPLSLTPAVIVPSYRLTVRITGSSDRSRWVYQKLAQAFSSAWVTGVTGPMAGSGTRPTTVACDDAECRTVVASFDLPAGVYSFSAQTTEWRDARFAYVKFNEPQVNLNGDTTLEVGSDKATWFEPRTPRPTELTQLAITETRDLPDGTRSSNLNFLMGDGYLRGAYLAPTHRPATTGAFHVLVNQVLQQPRVSMTVTAPRSALQLHPQYTNPVSSSDRVRYLSAESQSVKIVDAGIGSEDDFSGIDAKGKLVLVGLDANLTNPCYMYPDVMERARAAGAVAVVADPAFDNGFNHSCEAPVRLWGAPIDPAPDLPLITLVPNEAANVRALLGSGPVTMSVFSPRDQRLGYLYELAHNYQGGVPADADQSVTAAQLATRETRLHASESYQPRLSTGGSGPQDTITAGTAFSTATPMAPMPITEYIGPISPDITRNRTWTSVGGGSHSESSTGVFTGAATADEDFAAAPLSFGPNEPVVTADRTLAGICNFCRMGDVLYPFVAINTGAAPQHGRGAGLLPNALLVDGQGNPIPLTVDRVPVYKLPQGAQKFTLTSSQPAGSFEWEFTSDTAQENRPPGSTCVGDLVGHPATCEAIPLIYLRYVAPVSLNNTAPAGTKHTITVTAYHHAVGGPTITDVKTRVSFDGGKTWVDTKSKIAKDGSRSVTFTVPRLAATDGQVTLRTTAVDAAGNSTDQTLVGAYGLR